MANLHLLEIDAAGAICGEWMGDTDFVDQPIPLAGRTHVNVTQLGEAVGAMSARGCRVVDGEIVEPPPAAPVLSSREFLRLLTPAQFVAIQQLAAADAEVAYALAMAQAGGTIDLGHDDTKRYVALLVERGVLTKGDEARILAGTPAGR